MNSSVPVESARSRQNIVWLIVGLDYTGPPRDGGAGEGWPGHSIPKWKHTGRSRKDAGGSNSREEEVNGKVILLSFMGGAPRSPPLWYMMQPLSLCLT